MTSCYNAVEHMYDERNKLIIIGLTGRTGSGCSTVAKILSTESVDELALPPSEDVCYDTVEERKNYILNKYIRQPKKWIPFIKIDVSSLILLYVFQKGKDELIKYIEKRKFAENRAALKIIGPDDICRALSYFDDIFEEVKNKELEEQCEKYPCSYHNSEKCTRRAQEDCEITIEKSSLVLDTIFYTETILKYRDRFKSLLEEYQCYVVEKSKKRGRNAHKHKKYNCYTYFMQQFANNLRASGDPLDDTFNQDKYTVLPEKISDIIRAIEEKYKGNSSVRICIDAIRNPYEALYLRDKYKAFYLLSINTDENSRLRRLANLTKDEIDNLDKVEYGSEIDTPEKSFYHQNIQGCIEIANIHIHNKDISNNKYFGLTQQIVRYLALIQHPGLVTPTSIERCMQIAYNAKLNSGCLSRQVGAVVTRKDFSIQSVGWNDVPKGQIACNLRDVHDFCLYRSPKMHSKYEIENKDFLKAMNAVDNELSKATIGTDRDTFCEMCTPYCFKDVYQGITGEKNQVHTRALHAEENAFLQITKYGGTKVQGGYLFTTASPCELCSKKAYQLGISKIFYIDPYPGISKEHILTFGETDNPEMVLFQGAIGETYVELYRPRLPIKDEAEMRTGVKIKKIAKEQGSDIDLNYKDIKYKNTKVHMIFKTRTDILTRYYLEFKPLRDDLTSITQKFIWTESSFNSINLDKTFSDENMSLETIREESPALYRINFSNVQSKDGLYKYCLLISAKDEKKMMASMLEYGIHYKTEKLELQLEFPENLLSELYYVEYADFKGEIEFKREAIDIEKAQDVLVTKTDNGYTITKVIDTPRINYKYALEWQFKEDMRKGEC